MKKLLLTVLAVSVSLLGSAQLVEVASIDRVALPDGISGDIATLSPDGTYAVLGQMGGKTLYKVDLSTGATSVITDNGNASGVTISPDGNNVVFRTYSFDNSHLRHTGINCVDMANGREYQLVKPSRHLNAGIAISAAGITAVDNGRARVCSFNGQRAASMPVASINYGHLDITVGGKTTTIDPQGRGSYLWPSISPDGTKVAYVLSGAGAFVCNIDGTNPIALGRLHAPRWVGNDLIVGMDDRDNGQQITSSEVILTNLSGVRQSISLPGHIAIYPSASTNGSVVAYCTTDGELYIVTLK